LRFFCANDAFVRIARGAVIDFADLADAIAAKR
jgi:hypothetical protein